MSVVIDEDRAVYAAWGLGLGGVWHVLSPASQVQAWKEKGWLGASVAGAISRTGMGGRGKSVMDVEREERRAAVGGGAEVEGGASTALGNKWQTAGAWAVDGRGTVVWGGQAARADDVMDLEAGVRALGL